MTDNYREIFPGTTAKVRATFRDPLTKSLTNPTAVSGRLTSPTGTQTSIAMSNVSTGIYDGSVTPTTPGTWTVWIEGDGTIAATDEVKIFCRTPDTSGVPLT